MTESRYSKWPVFRCSPLAAFRCSLTSYEGRGHPDGHLLWVSVPFMVLTRRSRLVLRAASRPC